MTKPNFILKTRTYHIPMGLSTELCLVNTETDLIIHSIKSSRTCSQGDWPKKMVIKDNTFFVLDRGSKTKSLPTSIEIVKNKVELSYENKPKKYIPIRYFETPKFPEHIGVAKYTNLDSSSFKIIRTYPRIRDLECFTLYVVHEDTGILIMTFDGHKATGFMTNHRDSGPRDLKITDDGIIAKFDNYDFMNDVERPDKEVIYKLPVSIEVQEENSDKKREHKVRPFHIIPSLYDKKAVFTYRDESTVTKSPLVYVTQINGYPTLDVQEHKKVICL